MIVESWLNERSTSETRGRIFGIYTMINLGATTAGQMLLTLGDPTGFFFFVLGSIIYSLSLLPTALSTAASPQPLTQARLDPKNSGAIHRSQWSRFSWSAFQTGPSAPWVRFMDFASDWTYRRLPS